MQQQEQQQRVSLKSVGAIVAHPLRSRVWRTLTERVASPTELADLLGGEKVENVAYHVKTLERMGLIELVNTRPVRGSLEHFYRAIQRDFYDDADTASRSLEDRLTMARAVAQEAFAEAAISLDAGTFCERADHVIARVALMLDEDGWTKVHDALAWALEQTVEAQAESVERLGPDLKGIPASVDLMLFERPALDR